MESIWANWAVSKITDTNTHPVPYLGSDDQHERNLAKWYKTIKGKYVRGTLRNEEIERLEALPGWSWGKKRDEEFSRKAQMWAKWFEKRGQAPRDSVTASQGERMLARWAKKYQKLCNVKKLDDQHYKVLNEIRGWVWTLPSSRTNVKFDQHLQQWSDYVVQNGAAPTKGPLFKWFKRIIKMHEAGKLSQDRIQELEALPMWVWGDSTPEWLKVARRWSSWVRLNEKVFPSPYSTTNPVEAKLGAWASQTKEQVFAGAVPTPIVEELGKIYMWKEYMQFVEP